MSNPSTNERSESDPMNILNNGLSPLIMKPKQPSVGYFNGGGAYDLARLLPIGTPDGTNLNHFVNCSSSSLINSHQLKSKSRSSRPHSIHVDGSNQFRVTEHELIREILFAFQGLNGKIITLDSAQDGKFVIANNHYDISPSMRSLALRLCNMGWLFNKINKYCTFISKEKSYGHVTQSFASALKDEILEYHRLITVIEEQLHEDTVSGNLNSDAPRVSLLRLQVWSCEEYYRLKALSSLVEQCKHKKGGALAGVVYHNMQSGDPSIKNCFTRILNQVVYPIRRMLGQWIFHGELEDSYKEFFIVTNHVGRSESPLSGAFWHEKYVINKDMLPGFITKEQAEKILATGKAIYMLNEVCRNEVTASVPGYNDLKKTFESTNLESLFNKKRVKKGEGEFQMLLERAYKEISQTSLNILYDNYKLISHFKGLRQYMLLGQGDFIRHLMDVLSKQLDKPADKVAKHIVVPLLETAIRSTNAQYDDPDVLNLVDVRLLECSINETGWDVFTLAYRITGPISTIFTPVSQQLYLKLFKHLWRSKRMEYILKNIWTNQVFLTKYQTLIPDLKSAFHSTNTLLSEMIHFVQQMNYYFTFDVIECQWVQLLTELQNPKDVDWLIKSHNQFLHQVIIRSFLDEEMQELADQYRAICDNVLDFQSHLESLWKVIEDEIQRRIDFALELREEKVRPNDKTEMERRELFVNETIPKAKSKVFMFARTFQELIQKFLVMLADHTMKEFQELSARLDFNEHYKKRDKRLETSFTFASQKQRLSIDTPSKTFSPSYI